MVKVRTEVTIEVQGVEIKLSLEEAKALYTALGNVVNNMPTLPYIPHIPWTDPNPWVKPSYTTPRYSPITTPNTGTPLPDLPFTISCGAKDC